jgi:hypothetical protein
VLNRNEKLIFLDLACAFLVFFCIGSVLFLIWLNVFVLSLAVQISTDRLFPFYSICAVRPESSWPGSRPCEA